MRALLLVYEALFSPSGLLGVSGPCFDLLLILRETLETTLQTIQAYRMSQYLARAWLNRFYVSLLVLNCWLMALVHTLFHHTPTTRYFVTMLCDLVIDFVSSIVVPAALAMLYARDADVNAADVFGLKWYEDVWQMNAVNEFQLILVVSWADLASRLVFVLSMISTLNTLKRFVSLATDLTAAQGWRQQWRSIVPDVSTRRLREERKAPALQALVWANNAVKQPTDQAPVHHLRGVGNGRAHAPHQLRNGFRCPGVRHASPAVGDRASVVQPRADQLLPRWHQWQRH